MTPLIAWTAIGAFWGVCLLALLLRTWRGWRQGIARELVGIAALILGWLAGRSPGSGWNIPVRPIIEGIVVYIVVLIAGRVFFKKASDKSFGPTRVVSGACGAGVGFLVGCVSVWFLIIAIRLAGSIEQAQAQSKADGGGTALFPWMIEIKESLENGWVGDFVRFTDPLPPRAYTDLNKVAQVASDPRLQQRLLDAQALSQIASDPKVAAVRNDPDVTRAIERQDYLSLARNPHVQAVLNDPRVMRRLEKVDFSKLLDQTVKSGKDEK